MPSYSQNPVAMPPPPILLTTDHSTTPPITTRYTSGHNDIFFPTAYKQIKSLLTHPACPHHPSTYTWPCALCETTFTTTYWASAATLLDYFADFYPTDTPLMQSIWFYLLDIWQESAHRLPYESVLEETIQHSSAIPAVQRARAFEKAVRDTVTLFETTIWGRKRQSDTGDQVIFDPRGEAMCAVGEYETGPWISGVKPWNQFLGDGGVGVAAPCSRATDTGDGDEDGPGEAVQERKRETTRYIPHPAIAIIEGHTARARLLATTLFHKQDPASVTRCLAAFNAETVFLPSPAAKSHSYTSRITGRETSYSLSNNAPPVVRHEGLGDPTLELVCLPGDWNLLDECVASCRGVTAYVAVSGEDEDEDGDGDEDEEMADSENEIPVFDLWSVVEREVGGGGQREQLLELGDMFESWCGVDGV
jgi:hypothetical protein